MYQFQEGFPSPMIELRSSTCGQKPQTLTVSLQGGAGSLGSQEGEAQAQLTHQPKPWSPEETPHGHQGPWRRGLGARNKPACLRIPPVCDIDKPREARKGRGEGGGDAD